MVLPALFCFLSAAVLAPGPAQGAPGAGQTRPGVEALTLA